LSLLSRLTPGVLRASGRNITFTEQEMPAAEHRKHRLKKRTEWQKRVRERSSARQRARLMANIW
jgi:hypothetical protein